MRLLINKLKRDLEKSPYKNKQPLHFPDKNSVFIWYFANYPLKIEPLGLPVKFPFPDI